jgi:hypothetical protein
VSTLEAVTSLILVLGREREVWWRGGVLAARDDRFFGFGAQLSDGAAASPLEGCFFFKKKKS